MGSVSTLCVSSTVVVLPTTRVSVTLTSMLKASCVSRQKVVMETRMKKSEAKATTCESQSYTGHELMWGNLFCLEGVKTLQMLPPTAPRPRVENGEGSLDLSHELTANLSAWGRQSRALLQVLRSVREKVCWAPAVPGDVPGVAVVGMKGNWDSSNLPLGTDMKREFWQDKFEELSPTFVTNPSRCRVHTIHSCELWGLDVSEMSFRPLPEGQWWVMCPQEVQDEKRSRQSSASC